MLGLASVTLLGPAMGATIVSTYTGGGADNHWATPENWNPATPPSNDATDQYLITIPASRGIIVLNQNAAFNELTIGTGSELTIAPGLGLFPTDIIENNGLITFSTVAGNQRIQTSFDGSVSFTGTGTVRLNDSNFQGVILGQNGINTLTNGAGHTIEGFGTLGELFETAVNSGLINANVSGQILQTSMGITVDGGELRAESGGTLAISSNITGQNGGIISVGDDSLVQLSSGTVSSATISALDSDGDLSNNRVRIGSTITADNVTSSARIEVSDASNNRLLRIQNSFVNNGEIVALDEDAGFTGIIISGDVELSGTGKVILNEEGSHGISGTSGSETFLHAAGHTIEGKGVIGGPLEAIMTFTNAGLIHSNQGGILSIPAGRAGENFVNEPSGVLRVSNSGQLHIPGFSSAGQTFRNRGLIDVGENCFLDAALNPTLQNIKPTVVLMESGKIHSDGIFETDQLIVQSGIISGRGVLRAGATTCAENVIVRPGDGEVPGIGVLTFTHSLPTGDLPSCGGIFAEDLAGFSDVVQLGGSTFDLDIASAGSHDEIRFSNSPKIHAIGSIRLKLNITGPASGFSATDQIVIVSGIGFTTPVRGPGLGESLVDCGGSSVLVHPEAIGGLSVANLPASGRLTSYDGRASFRVVLSPGIGPAQNAHDTITLTESSVSTEVPAQSYVFNVDPGSAVGSVVATVSAPATITGTPTFAIIGDTPFEINPATGEITLATALDPGSPQTVFTITVNIYDGTNVQVNPTTITIGNNDSVVRGLLTGPGGPFEGQSDPAVVSPAADPDQDGIGNVFELWYGTDPTHPNPAPVVTIGTMNQGGMTTGTLDVAVDPLIDDLIAIDGEFSYDLIDFHPGIRQVTNSGVMRNLRFLDDRSAPGGRLFGRFRYDGSRVR